MQQQPITLEQAMDLADHASPAPWIAAQALKIMRSEIHRLRDPENGDKHPDDDAVDAFAAAMKAKLAEARTKGRGGWEDKQDCPQQRLSDMLRSHVEKGDPRDVANFCMFLHQRGEAILPTNEPNCAGYQRWVEFNWNRRKTPVDGNPLRDLYIMGLGIGGEAGEVQELLKKHVRDDREIVDDLILELGDVLHYLTRISSQFGITLEEVMVANREKIERRHAKREAASHTEVSNG